MGDGRFGVVLELLRRNSKATQQDGVARRGAARREASRLSQGEEVRESGMNIYVGGLRTGSWSLGAGGEKRRRRRRPGGESPGPRAQ